MKSSKNVQLDVQFHVQLFVQPCHFKKIESCTSQIRLQLDIPSISSPSYYRVYILYNIYIQFKWWLQSGLQK
jgi:hypothetical protein